MVVLQWGNLGRGFFNEDICDGLTQVTAVIYMKVTITMGFHDMVWYQWYCLETRLLYDFKKGFTVIRSLTRLRFNEVIFQG